MTNGVRHLLGLVAGVFLPVPILAGLFYSTGEITQSMQRFYAVSGTAVAVLLLTGVALAFLAGSRLSPVASLLGGLQFLVVGILPLLELAGVRIVSRAWLPRPMMSGYLNVGYTGLLLLLAVLLLVVSVFPSRWRGRPAQARPPVPYYPGPHAHQPYPGSQPHPGPSGPPPGERDPYGGEPWREDDSTRPMHRESASWP